jgi:hypothetical protein
MCTLCSKCVAESDPCYCARCPLNAIDKRHKNEKCVVCLKVGCSSVYCGYAIHALSSGKGECLRCIEVEHKVEFEGYVHCIFTTCSDHKNSVLEKIKWLGTIQESHGARASSYEA